MNANNPTVSSDLSGDSVVSALLLFQGLLKEQLELEKFKTKNGRVRFTVKPIDDTLPFDKVRTV